MPTRILHHISKALGVKSEEGDQYKIEESDVRGVDIFHEKVDRWVNPITLRTLEDVNVIKHELTQGNIVLLDMKAIEKMEKRSKEALMLLKNFCTSNKGDMARVTDSKFLLTPAKVRIVKRKK
ncbi:MAG: cell division protein SepF [Candidatus Micrarchaeota archaeon]